MTKIHPKTRLALFVLQVTVALAAIVGAVALLIRPDGSLLGLQPSYLVGFESYTFPAILLLALGLVHAVGAALVLWMPWAGRIASLTSGALLVLWMAIQASLVQPLHILELIGLLVGGAIFTLASELMYAEGGRREPAPA